ncbi:MAG: hypothetical protein JRI25_28680, partial [Deltaproteobacteria bacterium]|nr:hypothetical protein [Deltaproteobacteria bacterium]
TATPKDSDTTGTPVPSDARTISNSVPSITSVSITPTTAYADSTLTCAPSGWSDADDDDPGYQYAWTVDGDAAGSDASTLEASEFSQTDVVVCTATPDDGQDTGTSVPSSGRTISNRVPSTPVVSINAYPEAGVDDVVCTITTAATDDDGDTVTTTIEWLLDGTTWTGATGTTSLAGDTISADDLLGCDEWQCRAVADDGFDQTASAWEATLANSPHGTGDYTATLVDIPVESDVYASGFTAGFWFEAPGDFTIVGVAVPTDAGTEVQNIEVVRFDAAPYAQTNAYERLACFRDIVGSDVLETDPIDIFAGEIVGVLGGRGTTAL